MESARCIFEVTAGILPMEPENEFTRRFALTSSEWNQGQGWDRFIEVQEEAMAYATELQQRPNRFNFVRVDWIWL